MGIYIYIYICICCVHVLSAGIDNIDLIFARLIAIFSSLVHYCWPLRGDQVI